MRSLILALCVSAAACAGAAPTAPPSASSALASPAATDATGGSDLPFRGSFESTETINGALHHLTAEGTATHLGRFTLTADFEVNETTRTSVGTATWTAANGDQIFTTTAGQGVPTFPIVTITDTQTITGGTGRFANASGTVVVVRTRPIQSLNSTASISGTINLGH